MAGLQFGVYRLAGLRAPPVPLPDAGVKQLKAVGEAVQGAVVPPVRGRFSINPLWMQVHGLPKPDLYLHIRGDMQAAAIPLIVAPHSCRKSTAPG